MIKFLLRTVLVLVLLFLCLFTGLHTLVRVKGRELMTRKMSQVFRSDVTVGTVSTGFPLNLVISDVEVTGWFKVRKIVAGLGLLDLFSDDFILTSLRLQGLQMTLEKGRQPAPLSAGAVVSAQTPLSPKNETEIPAQVEPEPQSDFFSGRIEVKRLIISDAAIDLVDYSRQDQPITVALRGLEVTVENIRWPLENSSVMFFELRGRLPFAPGTEEGTVTFEGWINPYRRDMRATLDVKDIDGVALYPYYRDWLALEGDRIAKAKLNVLSNITSLRNEVNAACHLELTQIEFKPRQDDEADHRVEKMINAVIGLFKAVDEGKIVLDFNFKTKLDNPEFGLMGVIEAALKAKVQSVRPAEPPAEQIINFPGKVLKGTVTGTADLTKALINGTVSVGRELKKAVEVSFTREGNATGTAAESATVPTVNATQ